MKYYIVAFVYITSVPILAKRYLKFNEEPSDVVVLRNKPAELRCNVTAKNGATIFWYKDDKKLDLSNDTQRTIRPDGSLYFKTIVRKKRVSPDAGVYRCLAETKVSDKYFKLYSQKARLSVAGLSKSFATTPQNVTVSQSGTAFFECRIKRSRPEAKITWSKEGKNTDLTLNPRFVVFPSGTLEIGGVMQSDAGNYICKATNKELRRSVTAKATLTVTSSLTMTKPSQFLVKPRSTIVLENEDAILECIVNGYPKPQVEWLKDGTKITLTQSGHYSKYGVSSLKVSKAQTADSGKYECVMGTNKAEAKLEVVVPPKFKVLPSDIETEESRDIVIPCEATGVPKPRITWYKNGVVIDEDEFEHIEVNDDGIAIMQVLESDEGIYQCFAKNNLGEIVASSQLTMKVPPTTAPSTTLPTTILTSPTTVSTTSMRLFAPSVPKMVQATAVNTTAIRVYWQEPDHPHGKITKYTVVTFPVGAAPGSHSSKSMLTTQDTHLVVGNLQPDTLYFFVVYASNEYKEGEVSAGVQEKTMKEITPGLGPPRDVKVSALGSHALQVSWNPPLNALEVIRNYSIKYRANDRNGIWRTKTSLKLVAVLLKLSPYTEYSVMVTAHTDRGPGQTSSAVFARTKSGKPKGPPENVRLISPNNNILVASWRPPSDPNGNITRYDTELKNENSGKVNNSSTHQNNKMFNNVEKGATYAFRVAAVTEAGQGEFSQWAKVDTPSPPKTEDEVPGKPTNLRTQVLVGVMVRVSWDPPEKSHVIVRQYVVSYGKMKPDGTVHYVPNNTFSYLLKNLQPETIYVVRVRAKNAKGQGLEVMESVTIPRTKQSAGISNLRAVPIKERTMRLSWFDPTVDSRPVGYHVKFEKGNGWVHFNVTKGTSLIVENLLPGMTYTFYVKKNDEPNFISVRNDTKPEVPSAPKDVTVSISGEEGTVSVQWNIPDEQNGKLSHYKICWRPDSYGPEYNGTCKTVKAHLLNDLISNLNESLKYSVKISARNGAGEGPFSEPVQFSAGPSLSFTNGESKTDSAPTTKPKHDSTVPVKDVKRINSLTSDEKTLWIIIAVIAAVTLVAIVIISIVLCKKRSRGTPVNRRKPPADPYKAAANGSAKKKPGDKGNYWIKQDQMELEPCVKKDEIVAPTIPRSADEMKALDSPYQSRKDRSSPEMDEEEPLEPEPYPPTSFGDEPPPYKHREDYQPLPVIPGKADNINIQTSPFMPPDREEFPPPPECLDENQDEGPSSDYGSEEIVSPKCETDEPPAVTYMPRNTPNGCVSVAPDYDYPVNKHVPDVEASNLESLMKDLDAIMAKEDRV